MKVLIARLGQKSALIVSFITGSTIVIGLNFLLVPWLEPQSYGESFIIGLVWALAMVAYDVLIGRYMFGFDCNRILRDFDIRSGNLLSLGIILILTAPVFIFEFFMNR